jgi:excinuclease ABC subunit A
VYVLDEPTTGLHFEDVRKLLGVLDRLVEAGNTVIVIEHNLDVVKTADWVIDLGPEGGSGGGTIVSVGTPEQIAVDRDSHTGAFLAPLLASSTIGGPAAPGVVKKAPKKKAPAKKRAAAATPSATAAAGPATARKKPPLKRARAASNT